MTQPIKANTFFSDSNSRRFPYHGLWNEEYVPRNSPPLFGGKISLVQRLLATAEFDAKSVAAIETKKIVLKMPVIFLLFSFATSNLDETRFVWKLTALMVKKNYGLSYNMVLVNTSEYSLTPTNHERGGSASLICLEMASIELKKRL